MTRLILFIDITRRAKNKTPLCKFYKLKTCF